MAKIQTFEVNRVSRTKCLNNIRKLKFLSGKLLSGGVRCRFNDHRGILGQLGAVDTTTLLAMLRSCTLDGLTKPFTPSPIFLLIDKSKKLRYHRLKISFACLQSMKGWQSCVLDKIVNFNSKPPSV